MIIISILLFAILVMLIIIAWHQIAGPKEFSDQRKGISHSFVNAWSEIGFAARAKLALKPAIIASVTNYLVSACGSAMDSIGVDADFLIYMIIWVIFVGFPLAFFAVWVVLIFGDFVAIYRNDRRRQLSRGVNSEIPLPAWNRKGSILVLAAIGFFIAVVLALAVSD